MKAIKLLCVCLSVLMFAACSNEDMPETRSEFKVVSSILPLTRAPQLDQNGAGHFVNGDKNTVFFQSQEQQNLLKFTYTYGDKYYWQDLGLPANEKSVKVSACYPAVDVLEPAAYEWNVLSQADSDLLVAAPVAANTESSEPVSLSFTHALHKLVVELQADGTTMQSGDLKDAEISVNNFMPVAVVNFLSGKATSAKGELSKMAKKGTSAAFIVPAQAVGTMQIIVKLGNREAKYDLSSCQVSGQPLQNLLSGQSFKLKIKVSKSSFSIVGQNISGWGSQGESEGTIII